MLDDLKNFVNYIFAHTVGQWFLCEVGQLDWPTNIHSILVIRIIGKVWINNAGALLSQLNLQAVWKTAISDDNFQGSEKNSLGVRPINK